MATMSAGIAPMKVAQIPKVGADFQIVERPVATNYIRGAFAAPPLESSDYAAFSIAMNILQQLFFQEVRVKRNLTYGADATLLSNGANSAYISVTTQKPNEARERTWKESNPQRQVERVREGAAAEAEERRRDAEAQLRQIEAKRQAMERSLAYMGLTPGTPLQNVTIDRVFIGSCTNGRIEDLRAAAAVAKGRKVATRVQAMVVPGSGLVKHQAEEEGLDRIFREAGFEWREPGCSMCLAMNADKLEPGERCASTSNRNFEGRQGRGGRTHLMSPSMAAAAAIAGRLADVRELG